MRPYSARTAHCRVYESIWSCSLSMPKFLNWKLQKQKGGGDEGSSTTLDYIRWWNLFSDSKIDISPRNLRITSLPCLVQEKKSCPLGFKHQISLFHKLSESMTTANATIAPWTLFEATTVSSLKFTYAVDWFRILFGRYIARGRLEERVWVIYLNWISCSAHITGTQNTRLMPLGEVRRTLSDQSGKLDYTWFHQTIEFIQCHENSRSNSDVDSRSIPPRLQANVSSQYRYKAKH